MENKLVSLRKAIKRAGNACPGYYVKDLKEDPTFRHLVDLWKARNRRARVNILRNRSVPQSQ